MIDGYSKALYMTKEEIHDHARRYSRGYEKRDGVWQTNAEAMEKKTVLRLLLTRWGYLDPAAARLIESDEAPEEGQPVGSMTAAELAEIDVDVIDVKEADSETAKTEPQEKKDAKMNAGLGNRGRKRLFSGVLYAG